MEAADVTETARDLTLEAISVKPLRAERRLDLEEVGLEKKHPVTVLVESWIGALSTKLLYDYSRGIGPEHDNRILLAAEQAGADPETILRHVQLDEAGMVLVDPDCLTRAYNP